MNRLFKQALTAVALSAALATPAYAEVFLDFKVDETSVPNVPAAFQPLLSNFTADKITGNYSEILTVNAGNQFSVSAYADMGSYAYSDGTQNVAGPGLNTLYGLYAVFTSSGNILNGGATFQGTSGTIELYLDSYRSGLAGGGVTGKTLPAAGGGAVTRTNTADDYLVASTSTFVFGEGHNNPGNTTNANGDFSITFSDFVLTAVGKQYFYAPVPFYLQFTVDGNFGTFPLPGVNGSTTITGAANAFFIPVPEPGMLALLGIGLLGLTFNRRRGVSS